jgi:methionine aminotransferase
MQVAIAEYLKDENTYLSLAAFFQQKRDYFRKGWNKPVLTASLPGSYFQSVTYDAIYRRARYRFCHTPN